MMKISAQGPASESTVCGDFQERGHGGWISRVLNLNPAVAASSSSRPPLAATAWLSPGRAICGAVGRTVGFRFKGCVRRAGTVPDADKNRTFGFGVDRPLAGSHHAATARRG